MRDNYYVDQNRFSLSHYAYRKNISVSLCVNISVNALIDLSDQLSRVFMLFQNFLNEIKFIYDLVVKKNLFLISQKNSTNIFICS